MSDVTCPYCKHDQDINHDDGYGHHEQECVECTKTFTFFTSISFSYEVFCVGGHNLELGLPDEHKDFFVCKDCDYLEIRRGLRDE